MKTSILAAALALAAAPLAVQAADAPPAIQAPSTAAGAAPAKAATPQYYGSNTTMGELLATPATRAVMMKVLPMLAEAPADQLEQGAGLSPREIQQYAPDTFTDAALKQLDEELAKVPAPKPPEPAKPATAATAAAPTPPATPAPPKPSQ